MLQPLLSFTGLGLLATSVSAGITIYGPLGSTSIDTLKTGAAASSTAGAGTVSAPATTSFVTTPGPPQYTGLEAYNPIFYEPPPIPDPAPATSFTIALPNGADKMNALSIPQQGTFMGFSIEMSVATQVSK